MNLTEFVFGALEILHYVERKSVKLQQLPTLDDALAWLTLARDSEANGHNQHILFKYSLSVLVATPLRDAPTRVSRNPAQIESPLKSLLRDMLLSNSPLVSTADIAVAFGVQFGARALDATIADSLARFASNPHAQSPQQVTSALELVLVLLKHHLSVNAIERARELFRGPIGAAAMRVAATSNDAAHLQRVCELLGIALGQLGDGAAGDRLLDLLVLSRDAVRVFAAKAFFDGVLHRLASAPADDESADDNDARYPRQPIEMFRLAMQFRFADDELAYVCATAAMQLVERAAADGRADDVDSDALICVVTEYMVSLRQTRKTAHATERDVRIGACEQFLRALSASAQALVANAVAYYVVGKHEGRSKRQSGKPNQENRGSLQLNAAELAVTRALTQVLDPITQGPTVECIAENVGIASVDGASRALRHTLFGSAKKRKPLE